MTARSGPKVAVVCGGGGVTGGVFEVGALRALDRALGGGVVENLDCYIGVSAGAIVATGLAAGLGPIELEAAIVSGRRARKGPPPMRRGDIYGLDAGAWVGSLARMPVHMAGSFVRGWMPGESARPTDGVFAALQGLPSGLFSNAPLRHYIESILEHRGQPQTFEGFRKELRITAVNVDTGHRVVFGDSGTRDVPVAAAVQASAALPILFKPVRIDEQDFIDGGIERNCPVDIAVQEGATLVIALNPLVPIVNDPRTSDGRHWSWLSDKGLAAVADQVFRMLIRSQTLYGLQAMRERYPEVDLVFFEPEAGDATMFQWNPMRYSVRSIVARHAYDQCCERIRRDAGTLRATFARHGLDFDVARLDTPSGKTREDGAGLRRWTERLQRLPRVGAWLKPGSGADAPF